jgi:hypothetical protein
MDQWAAPTASLCIVKRVLHGDGGNTMSILLNLPSQVEERLKQEATRRGLPADACAVQLLDQHLPPALDERRAAAVAMLHRWAQEDAALPAEELAENADLLRALDEDRPSYRKLFTNLSKDAPK